MVYVLQLKDLGESRELTVDSREFPGARREIIFVIAPSPLPPFSVCIANTGVTALSGVCIANKGLTPITPSSTDDTESKGLSPNEKIGIEALAKINHSKSRVTSDFFH